MVSIFTPLVRCTTITTHKLLAGLNPSRAYKGNALIITISILLLTTAQLLFMGLVTSSGTVDEALLTAQNAEAKDAINLGFVDLENRINIVSNNFNVSRVTIATVFANNGVCMPSYRRDATDINTILASTAQACPYQIVGNTTLNTLLRSRLDIETVGTDNLTRSVQAPLDRYTQIDTYIVAVQGNTYILEGRVVGKGLDLRIQKRLIPEA
jgi:hypothetical protein